MPRSRGPGSERRVLQCPEELPQRGNPNRPSAVTRTGGPSGREIVADWRELLRGGAAALDGRSPGAPLAAVTAPPATGPRSPPLVLTRPSESRQSVGHAVERVSG